MPHIRQIGWAALGMALMAPVQAATIFYVNHKSTCTTGCGSVTQPFKTYAEASSAITQPGTEIHIMGQSDGAPYYLVDPKLGVPATVEQTVVNLAAGSSIKPAVVRGAAGLPKPILRGTLPVRDWTRVSSSSGYLYVRNWTVRQRVGNGETIQPQQVFRDRLPDGQRALTQIGGSVFGGYYPGMPEDVLNTKFAGLREGMGASVISLWPGYKPFVSLDQLKANQFYFDSANNKLYVKLATALVSGEALEVAAAQFVVEGNDISGMVIKDLVIERSNTSTFARSGAMQMAGAKNNVLDGLEFRDADSNCLGISGDGNTVQRSTFVRCGQIGLAANGYSNKFVSNYITGANHRGFLEDWEAGATKFIGNDTGLKNSLIRGNVIVGNFGHGVWIDTIGDGNTIDGNVVAFNRVGIYLEESASNKLTQNVIFGNRAQAIQLRGGPGTQITGNVMVGNQGAGVLMTHAASISKPQYRFKTLDPMDTARGVDISGNVMAWHWELEGNWTPVVVVPSTTLSNNRYCGVSVPGVGSMRFWLQDWVDDPATNYADNTFVWNAWRGVKQTPGNPQTPMHDAVGSVMQLTATAPTRVAAWVNTPELALAGTTSNIGTTRNTLMGIVNGACK